MRRLAYRNARAHLLIVTIVGRAANDCCKRVRVLVEWKIGKFERVPQQLHLGYPQGDASSGVQRSKVEVVETVARADLLWDDSRGLCLRIYRDDSKSFVFVYRIGDRQRFIRIGTSPPWSLKAARARTKELRSILDKGRDPAR